MIEQPDFLEVSLFQHQRKSVYEMEKLERKKYVKKNNKELRTIIGVQGDIVGYGKTLSMLTLVLRDKMEMDPKITVVSDASKFFYGTKDYTLTPINCTLIVANQTLLGQWEKELKKFTKKVAYKIITTKKHIEETDPNSLDIVLCSSARYNEFIAEYPDNIFIWKRFIFDEAASTRIPKMKALSACFSWMVTATYRYLYRVRMKGFLTPVFQMQSLIDYFLVKNDDAFVLQSFTLLPPKEVMHKCKQPKILRMMHDMIPDGVAEMIAADNIQGAIAALGGTISDGSNIVQALSNKFKEKARIFKEKALEAKNKNDLNEYARCKAKMDEYVIKYKTVKARVQENLKQEECPICGEENFEKAVMTQCCNNMCCGPCMAGWLSTKKSCPFCRANMDIKDLIYKMSKDEEKVESAKPSKKQKEKKDIMIDIVKKSKRCIIFSSYNETFDRAQKILEENGISSIIIQGTKETREKKIRMYESGEVKVILLNSKMDGAGLNLQVTSDIIIYHNMPQAIERQVIGRGQRVGREGQLVVHRFSY